MEAQRAPFPSEVTDFAADDRISYSHEAKTYILEDEQGQEWEWLAALSKWTKTMDEAAVRQQAEIYKIPGVDEDEPALNPAQKRKEAMLEDPETNPRNAKAEARKKPNATASAATPTPRQNRAVYVTGIPLDADHDEVRKFFMRYGMLAESADNDEKRIIFYCDKDGNFKGEALIIFNRPESVSMAVDLANDADFVRTNAWDETSKISVEPADMTYKAQKDDQVAEEPTKAKSKGKIHGNRALAKKKAEEMNRRLADWSDDDMPAKPVAPKETKTVILRNVFTLEEARDEPYLVEDIHEDLMEDAAKYGEVKNITVFDLEKDGIVTIRFATAAQAFKYGKAREFKRFAGHVIETEPATGNEKFKKSRKAFVDKEAEEAKRLEEYSKFIESGKGDASS